MYLLERRSAQGEASATGGVLASWIGREARVEVDGDDDEGASEDACRARIVDGNAASARDRGG